MNEHQRSHQGVACSTNVPARNASISGVVGFLTICRKAVRVQASVQTSLTPPARDDGALAVRAIDENFALVSFRPHRGVTIMANFGQGRIAR